MNIHASNVRPITWGLADHLPTSDFHSTDFDQVREHVGKMFCEHDMQLINRRDRLDTVTRRFACRSVTLVDMAYGADVLINPGSLEQFYLVQIPIAGSARVAMGRREIDVGPGMATVQNPDVPLEMFWRGNCRKLVLRFERASLERFAELYFGRSNRGALELAPTFGIAEPIGAALGSLVGAIEAFARTLHEPPSAILQVHWETCFISALLMLHEAFLGDQAGERYRSDPPHSVRRVCEYLREHAQDAISLADLSQVGGVPLRTLHHQFRHALGTTPMQHLREIRLEAVRSDLLRAEPGSSVTSIALQWGFDHLGRFAAGYRQRFGESPRETLSRSRLH